MATKENKKMPKIGLALSGGGGRGYAHIGVIKTFVKHNIPIDIITGCSAGSLFGSMYAASKDIEKVERIALDNNFKKLLDLVVEPTRGGVIKGDKIRKFIEEIVHYGDFEDLKIPFAAVATDAYTAEAVVLRDGDVAQAVQASIAFPFVFKSVKLKDRTLVDGGMCNPMPTDIAREMGADIVIGVNLNNHTMFDSKKKPKENIYSAFIRYVVMLQYSLAREYAKLADVMINPCVGNFCFVGIDKFLKNRGKDFILEGERTTEEVIPKIKELISHYEIKKSA